MKFISFLNSLNITFIMELFVILCILFVNCLGILLHIIHTHKEIYISGNFVHILPLINGFNSVNMKKSNGTYLDY